MTDTFLSFLENYPQREEFCDVERTREAWAGAIRRARPETIIAAAENYRKAREGQPARYTMSARRWLSEGRWRDFERPDTPPAQLLWIAYGSREWDAWTRYRGKTPPLDRRGGWRFPSRLPPMIQAAE
ncbi:hypothetical protein AMST5_01916 [freshwater sediment metagenome]|uniref:Uncharacterized protein n=1 Tax=freshwater sediment metagenome TaxID=556182 RepID=A0AA48RE30_9ZZZZ